MEIKPTGIKGFSEVYDDEGNVTMTLTYIEPKEKDQLQNNWNELKKYIENELGSKYIHKYDVLDKMQELENK